MNNIKQLSRLLVFATVVKHGSFTQAASSLGISKSAVSQQIKNLEREMDIQVLNRTTRGISMTALGEKLFTHCQLLIDQVNLIVKDIDSAQENPKGRFSITFPHSFEATIVMPAIEQLCLEFPDLEPELFTGDHNIDLIENNIDVAIRAGELPDSNYRALPVGTITEIFCATPLFLNRTLVPKTLNELSQLKWIATSWQNKNMPVYQVNNGQKALIKLNQFAQVNTFPSALSMGLRHLGVVLLPDVIARPLIKSGELVHILEQYTGPLWPLHTMHAYHREKPVHLTRFHQLICQYFNGLTNN